MKNAKTYKVSQKGYDELLEELDYLKTTKRTEIAASLKTARSYGDLSENSEYDEAKNEQAKNEVRIAEIEDMLKKIEIINENQLTTDTVSIGSKVLVHDYEYDEDIEYTIKGSTEASPLLRIISDESPIGKALLGAKKGQEVTVVNPDGHARPFKVLGISK